MFVGLCVAFVPCPDLISKFRLQNVHDLHPKQTTITTTKGVKIIVRLNLKTCTNDRTV